MAIFIPTYFSPISQYAEIIKANDIIFETKDNYQKQSYRNRCYIYNGNGKQLLSVPVKHKPTSERKKTKDTLIENDFPWQDQHFKSLQTAYRVSPYFEFYEDEIAPIFEKKYIFLHDLNMDTFNFLNDALQMDKKFEFSKEYKESYNSDFRFYAERKHKPKKLVDKYVQMFDDKHGFIPNLSILDLLFMEGPNSINYL